MTAELGMLQGLMLNVAVTTAALVIFGAIVVFLLMYLILERKKKTLIAVFLVALAGFGAFYWSLGRKTPIAPLDVPKPVVTETIRKTTVTPPAPAASIPVPRPRPHKKKPAPVSLPQKQTRALDICPPHLLN